MKEMSPPVAWQYFVRRKVLVSGLAVYALAVIWVFWPGLRDMVMGWSRAEYSHGYLIPVIALYLLARRLPEATSGPFRRRWLCAPIVVASLFLGALGRLSNIHDLSQYGFILSIVALLVAIFGMRAAVSFWAPVLYLVFMVPLPQFIYLTLSAQLQLVSSELGVWFIRLAGLPVLLEGNIIDLGVYKMQVAEACSGLRYLFPLMSFGFLFAVLYRGPVWGKAFLFLSTIPITIVMNSFRIGVTGILLDSYGVSGAEGFFHWFEGWVIFVASVAILFIEAYALHRFRRSGGGFLDAIDLRIRDLGFVPRAERIGLGARPVIAIAAVALGAALALQIFPCGHPPNLERQRDLALFPNRIGAWRGERVFVDPDTLKVLAADDYIVADYMGGQTDLPINLFIAFFRNQSDGRAVHSPEVCIPGAGWEIRDLRPAHVSVAGQTLTVNRAIIQKGVSGQLVYYWFDQRGRRLVNEYAVKWFILWMA